VTTTVAAGRPWAAITEVCRKKGPRVAAVAYLGNDAPRLLPLQRGDVLVVNASDQALLCHATSPDALQAFVDAGVAVSSSPSLHAKVLATATHAVIGSANASASSTRLDEAVVITDSRAAVNAVRRFVRSLDDTTAVDDNFLDAARAVWARGRQAGPPGAGGDLADAGLLPAGRFRLYLAADTSSYLQSDAEAQAVSKASRRARRGAGPAAAYYLDSFRTDAAFRVGDVLIQVCDDDAGVAHLWPPVVVISGRLPVRGVRDSVQLVRGRVGLDPIPVDEAAATLAAQGVNARLGHPRFVTADRTRVALLNLWDL
jgi:hypothetical protein